MELAEWIYQFHLELESMTIKDMLSKHNMNNAKMRDIVDDTSHILNRTSVNIIHCFREANRVADALAKNASVKGDSVMIFAFQNLPGDAKGPFHLDNWQLPSFRIRYDIRLIIVLVNCE